MPRQVAGFSYFDRLGLDVIDFVKIEHQLETVVMIVQEPNGSSTNKRLQIKHLEYAG